VRKDKLVRDTALAARSNPREVALANALCDINAQWFSNRNAPTVTLSENGPTLQLDTTGAPGLYSPWDGTKYLKWGECPALDAIVTTMMEPYFLADKDAKQLEVALNTLFENTANLNRALEAMPNLISWVPDYAKVRLNAEATRAAKRTITPEEARALAFGEDAVAAAARARMFDK
jgi:hypothetical protein